MEAKSTSPKQTEKVGTQLARSLQGGEVIALYGNLGAGKTVLVQGIAKGLGIKRRVTSPTFVFMRSYVANVKGKNLDFYHLDMYRGDDTDFGHLGLAEIFNPNSIVVLEWAEKIDKYLPKNVIKVIIEQKDARTRKITIRNK